MMALNHGGENQLVVDYVLSALDCSGTVEAILTEFEKS